MSPPRIDAKVVASHDAAQERGEALYEDPNTGLWVMTAAHLRSRGTCCGKGCRHCPWPPEVQRAAGRPQD